MPDTMLAERPAAMKPPGAEWPKIEFKTHRVKASIVVLAEFATADGEQQARQRIEGAIETLRKAGVTVETSYDQV